MSGENSIMITMPMLAPMKLETAVIDRATAARPCFAIGYPSRQVTEFAGVPGTFSRIDAIDPP